MAPVLHVIMFPKFIAKVHIYSYNDVLIMYAHIQSSQTMWPPMLTFKTETFQPIPLPFPLPCCCQIPHWQPLSNMQLTSITPRHWIIIKINKVLRHHIRKHLEGAILIPADDKRLNGVTRKTSGRSSWLMVMDMCMCGCQHTAYLIFVLTVYNMVYWKNFLKVVWYMNEATFY